MIEIKKRGRKPKSLINKELFIDTNKINVETNTYLYFDDDNINEYEHEKNNENNINNISLLWLDKYKPQNIDEIIGNKTEINILKEWLINYSTSIYHTVVISGSHGVGKNLIIELLLNSLNYTIKYIDINTLKNKNIFNELINTCIKANMSVMQIINNKYRESKYAVIINDTESITLTSEKKNILKLFKLNNNKYFPLIFISNLQHSKLINNIKKASLNIILNKPNIEDIKEYIIKICKNENLNIIDSVYYNIINYCQFDMRRMLVFLQDLYSTYKNNLITLDEYKNFISLTNKKNIDIELYNLTKELLNKYKNINYCLELYESEKVLLPLTIYENYYKKIFKQKIDNYKILSMIADISNSISIGNEIETNIYSEQNWYLQNIHGFYTCIYTSYAINNLNNNINVPLSYLVFSADLNKTSTKNINKKKNIFVLQNKFNNKCIYDIFYINKIFYELTKLKKKYILNKIKKSYELDNRYIQIALKIDKTNIN